MRIGFMSAAVAAFTTMLLTGCNSTEDTLRPLSNDANISETNQSDAQTEPAAASQTIRFTPIIGAPIESITPLSRQLAIEAKTRGFAIRASNEQSANEVLKGYLSAFNDGQQTAVIYVWDVLDPTGNRLHRIQGQEVVPGAASDAWASVPSATMERIATRIFEDYQSWRQRVPS